MSTNKADILISGGGIAGLTLALLLSDIGLTIHVLEPFPPKPFKETKPTGRTVALMDSSVNVIKAAGVWDIIKEHTAALKTMTIIDDSQPGAEVIEAAFDATDIGLEQYGFNCPNSLLRAALFERAQAVDNIQIHTSALQSFETQKASVTATLENGERITAALLIGADGRNSSVRKQSEIEK